MRTAQEIIDQLEAQRPARRAHDLAVAREHRAQEVAYLKRFRDACREAARWDYETAKRKDFSPTRLLGDNYRDQRPPTCPARSEHELNMVLNRLKLVRPIDKINPFTMRWSDVQRALLWNPAPVDDPATVC